MYRDNITRSVGLSYIFLGGYYALGIASINKQTIASISVSAFLFVLSDFIQSYSEKYKQESTIFQGLQLLATFSNALAIMIMLIFPFMDSELTNEFLDIAGTSLTLASLGFTIFLMAKKNEEKNNRQLEVYKEESRKMRDRQELFTKEVRDIMREYNEEKRKFEEEMAAYDEILKDKE